MNLSEYISKVGDAKAAELFSVKERTAASWRRGERRPSRSRALEIVQVLNGLLSLEDCFDQEKKAA